MKLSVSLSDDDVSTLDAYVARIGLPSRSAGVQRAIQMLRHPDLEKDYAEAWGEWDAGEDSESWDNVIGDGLADAPR
ncbi:antitoxin MazE9 [Mycolicibacterium insubricum]|jgi:hypothetical protein|uniref:Antitoxin n=1 Tax=Mycolicibacterium insubricum TaxID=444597 RepID=A0A1X0D5P9_9MYCO|nr:antitoxin [Mycolicibacterium insubricum]MCB9441707.1 antitoxin [Mycolicibacterium sp.]MCV7080894.1 antitoxin [Mycolicibacterium insubricum]ORA67703.1 antitoxin [Mycolicibacterium insubricum]BBZ67313.1 antitoxin MazE9 [Mycolicibacterium insubricum]